MGSIWQSTGTSETDILSLQKEIVGDEDLEVFDKGYFLASFISHPSIANGSLAEQAALLGGLFESEKFVPEEEAKDLLAEATKLLS